MSINLTEGLTEPSEASSDQPKSGLADDGAAAPATATEDIKDGTEPPSYEIRNCINDHVIVCAGPRYFRLSPLGHTDGDDRTIETFALHDLADQHIVGLLRRDQAYHDRCPDSDALVLHIRSPAREHDPAQLPTPDPAVGSDTAHPLRRRREVRRPSDRGRRPRWVRGARINRTNPYPIFLAGVLLVLGWLLVLPVVDNSQDLADPATVASYLKPSQTTYVFGFLGAYFFALNLIARRYVRGDLRPKAYGTISVRILTVVILSWVLEIAFDPDEWLYVAAFLVGIVPETFFTLVAEGRRALLGWFSDALREPHPLTSLEGIDLYDRSRLQDEGVNNVEALAHHDLVELMLATRIPVPRLVDWVDQAILYLHTVDERGKGFGREHLRRCGIRTASDLIAAHEQPDLWAALLAGDDAGIAGRLDLVHAAIGDDEWMRNVLEWRTAESPGDRRFHVVEGGAVPDS